MIAYRPLLMTCLVFLLTCWLYSGISLGQNHSTKDHAGQYLDVIDDGRVVARYMYAHDLSSKESRHDTYKPYLHVMGPDGQSPITKGPGGQYTHHRGIFLGWNKIRFRGKSHDLWHMRTSEIVHREFLETSSNEKQSTIKARLDWLDDEGEVILKEVRTIVIDHADEAALFAAEFSCELTAVNDAVELDGDPEHAGFQYRPHNEVSENKSAKYLFHQEGIDPKKDKDLPWVALNYQLDGATYTVQHMNHPDNPGGTIYSAYRDYGRFGAFPKLQLDRGESVVLKYKIRVGEGEMPERDVLAKHYRDYID